MTKALALTIVFLLLAVLQTSFFASLPGLLAYAPLVVACGVYLRQHVQERSGTLWIAGFGVFLDILAIPSFPFETISYAVAAVVTALTAGRVFSNRSWYGLLACGASTVAALGITRAIVLSIVSLRRPELVSWDAFGETFLWSMVLLPVLLSLCFAFAGHIRSFLRTTFMISRDRETL